MPRTRFPQAILTPAERRLFRRLDTPRRIQDFLESFPVNYEPDGETCKSPRQVLRTRTAHCIEAAFLAAAVLWFHGEPPLLLDLRATDQDDDHVVTPFRARGLWGAISKTNHSVLRYRDPLYRDVRELAMSYFHEYQLDDGRKSLASFSDFYDLRRHGDGWITEPGPLSAIEHALDDSRHHSILRGRSRLMLRRADRIEIRAIKMKQWPPPGRRRRSHGR